MITRAIAFGLVFYNSRLGCRCGIDRRVWFKKGRSRTSIKRQEMPLKNASKHSKIFTDKVLNTHNGMYYISYYTPIFDIRSACIVRVFSTHCYFSGPRRGLITHPTTPHDTNSNNYSYRVAQPGNTTVCSRQYSYQRYFVLFSIQLWRGLYVQQPQSPDIISHTFMISCVQVYPGRYHM